MQVVKSAIFDDLPTNGLEHCLCNGLRRYYISGEMFDVTIKCSPDDKTFSAHKLILSAISPFFHNALVGPLRTDRALELPFTSTTVRFLLDCLYQYHDENRSEDVDIMEFIQLATYLDLRDLVKHGLRVAVLQLKPDSCLDILIEIFRPDADPVPHQWKEIVVRYAVDHLDYDYLNSEEGRICNEDAINKLPCDVIHLLCYSLMEHNRPLNCVEFTSNLVKSALQRNEVQDDEELFFKGAELQNKDISSMLKYVVKRDTESCEKVEVVTRPKVDDVLVQLRTVTKYDDDTDEATNIKRWSVEYVFNLREAQMISKDDLARFSNSLSDTSSRTSSFSGIHREDERKYFMWSGELYSAHFYLEKKEFVLTLYVEFEYYDWVKGCWVKAFRAPPFGTGLGTEMSAVFPCSMILCASWEMFSFAVAYNRAAHETFLLINLEGSHHSSFYFHGEKDASRMELVVATGKYIEDVQLLLFFTPLELCTLPITDDMEDDDFDYTEVELSHHEENFVTQTLSGKMICYNDIVFHFYSKKHNRTLSEGIFLDRLDLAKKTWIKLEQISPELKFVDALIMDTELYLVYTKSESDDQFICKCHVMEDLNIQLMQSTEKRLKEKDYEDDYEKMERFVMPRSALPLDFI